jgi:hypothetical protein
MDVVGFNADGSPIYDNPPVIIFRNANQLDFNPGNPGAYLGNYKSDRLTGPGRFTFDIAMSKSIEFMEGKRFEIRVDIQNVLNHASPIGNAAPQIVEQGGRYVSIDSPTMAISTTAPVGLLQNKGGHRTFQARLALRF